MLARTRFLALASLFLATSVLALGQKKPIDHSTYDGWKNVVGTTMSNDGHWVAYAINPQEGDGVVEVRDLSSDKKYTIERGTSFRFSNDGKFLIATVIPKFEETKKAKKDKLKPEDMPKNSLVILDLGSG